MVSDLAFVDFVCAQIQELGNVRYRKMFGDYMVYVNEKAVILVCDNVAYVKMLPEISQLIREAEVGVPYDGAKPHYILDVEHKDFLLKVVRVLEQVLPYPKKKHSKKSKQ